jgi:hypothetical protein
MRCKICKSSFETDYDFDRHLSYVHGTNHLQIRLGIKHLKEDLMRLFPEEYQKHLELKLCVICKKPAIMKITVTKGYYHNFAGSCKIHQGIVRKFLQS